MKKVLVLNISTDSKNTSLGFAISWLNAFAKKFDEVHVISLSKGSDDELEKNVTVYSVDNELGRISKIINLYKLINKLTKSNKYEFDFYDNEKKKEILQNYFVERFGTFFGHCFVTNELP